MSAPLDALWQPITVGTLELTHRLVVPPHGGGNGNLMGSDEEFEQHCAHWLAKIRGGVQWIGGGPNFVRNPLPEGFEPTGVGAHGPGIFRDPRYPERLGAFSDRIHDANGLLSVQMVLQGGMPIGPSATYSGHSDHRIAHALDLDEVRWLVREYAESAAIALDAGADAIELHANHDDVIEWFLSPATNHRTDAYGGDFEARRRLLREIVGAVRSSTTRPFTFGLRLCLDQMLEGGFGVEHTQRLVETFTREGEIDYFSLDIGNNWNAPSYIPIGWHDDHEWAPLAGQIKRATHLPVIYTGRVTQPEQAAGIVARGEADLVGAARALMADDQFVTKARDQRADEIRPCLGLNECIHRKMVEGLTYACGVNPAFARERAGRPPRTLRAKSVLVIGGGPAGSEAAALCAEQGHRVQLWERASALGGALAVAAQLRGNAHYGRWIDWQTRRLSRVGVGVRTGVDAAVHDVMSEESDVVLVATGAKPRVPPVPGVELPGVIKASAAIGDPSLLGERVALVVEDDGPAPPTLADHLAALGHRVTMIMQTPAVAPLVGKYSLGTMLARLDEGGVELVPLARLMAVHGGSLELMHTYSGRRYTLDTFDSVVLACGATPRTELYDALKDRHPLVRLLGDAYAPRRMVFATRQAWATMLALN